MSRDQGPTSSRRSLSPWMVSRTTSLLDSLHTTKAVASYSTATEICASALSRNFAVEGGHNASERDELAPLRSIVSGRQRAVNRFANSRVVMSARRTPPSGATCWRGQFNIRWVVLMEVRPLRWVLEGLREHMSDETDATGERRRRWRLGSVARASSGRPERPQRQLEIGCKISNLASRRYVPPSYAHVLAHPGPP